MYQDDYRRIDEMMRKKGVFTNLETGKQYYTGYEYATLYDWDQYFETIANSSSVVPFSSCLQSFPALGSFQMSQFFASSGQSIGVSASASVLPMNI